MGNLTIKFNSIKFNSLGLGLLATGVALSTDLSFNTCLNRLGTQTNATYSISTNGQTLKIGDKTDT